MYRSVADHCLLARFLCSRREDDREYGHVIFQPHRRLDVQADLITHALTGRNRERNSCRRQAARRELRLELDVGALQRRRAGRAKARCSLRACEEKPFFHSLVLAALPLSLRCTLPLSFFHDRFLVCSSVAVPSSSPVGEGPRLPVRGTGPPYARSVWDQHVPPACFTALPHDTAGLLGLLSGAFSSASCRARP